MSSYVALVGHQPALSRAELAARFPDIRFSHTFQSHYILFETAAPIDQAVLQTLGGTILIAAHIDAKVVLDDVPSLLVKQLAKARGKVTFSLRLVGISPRKGKALFRDCKSHLRAQNISSRYVGSERIPAQAIQLHDAGLLDPGRGCELVVLQDDSKQWIGRTIAAQDVKEYTKRDMEKPVRDTTVGLLPPKLAQILLNFGAYLVSQHTGKFPKKISVFDPFCGTGVILIESMLRGWNVLASDAEVKAVNGCRKNIEWVRKTYKIFKKDIDDTVWKQDATKAFTVKNTPDLIVTEGTLGPALRQRPTLKEVEKMLRDAEVLESSFLANCHATLPYVPVVLTVPVWYTQKRPIFLSAVFAACHDNGYTPVLPPHTSPSVEGRHSLLYRRSDQFVGREIILLLPKRTHA